MDLQGPNLTDIDLRHEAILKNRAVTEAIQSTVRSEAAAAIREEYSRQVGPWAGISEPLYLKLKACRSSATSSTCVDEVEVAIQQQMLSQNQTFEQHRQQLEKQIAQLQSDLEEVKAINRMKLLPPSEPIHGLYVAPPDARQPPASSFNLSHRLSVSDRKQFMASSMQGSGFGRSSSARNPSSSPQNKSVSAKETLSAHVHLIIESLAAMVSAQRVRLFLFDNHNNLLLTSDFPRHSSGGPSLDDTQTGHRRWARSIRTVANRNMAIVGHSLSADQLSERGTLPSASPEADRVHSYMCWPIRAEGSPSVVKGVLEVINKGSLIEGTPFSPDDESCLHHVSRSLSALLGRYQCIEPVMLEASQVTVSKMLSGLQGSTHLPHVPEAPFTEYVSSAQKVILEALEAKLDLPVFRGSMHTVRTSQKTVESVAHKTQGTTQLPSLSRPATATTTVEYQWEQPSQLTRTDYAMDSLASMWRQEHEENIAMHEQVRYWSGRVRDLSDMTKCFSEAISRVKGMRSAEDIQAYLRSLDLSVRTTNVGAFLAAVDVDGLDNPQTQAVINSRRIEVVDEGPEGVRSFTLDAESKRQQQRDIASHILRFEETAADMRNNQKTIHFIRPTVLSTSRERPRRPSWQIEQRNQAFEAKRQREQLGRIGVPPVQQAPSSPRSRKDDGGLQLPSGLFAPSPPTSRK